MLQKGPLLPILVHIYLLNVPYVIYCGFIRICAVLVFGDIRFPCSPTNIHPMINYEYQSLILPVFHEITSQHTFRMSTKIPVSHILNNSQIKTGKISKNDPMHRCNICGIFFSNLGEDNLSKYIWRHCQLCYGCHRDY